MRFAIHSTFQLSPDVRGRKAHPSTGGVPWVWNDSIVFSPHACPFLRSSSVQTIGFQSGARMTGAGVGDLYAIAAGLIHIQKEGLLDGVLVRAGLDVDAVLQENVGGAQNVFAAVEGVGDVMETARRFVVIA